MKITMKKNFILSILHNDVTEKWPNVITLITNVTQNIFYNLEHAEKFVI